MVELNKKTIRNIFLGIAGCIILYWVLHETSRVEEILSAIGNMLSPFLVGAALAFVLNVPMRAIEGCLKKIKNLRARRALALTLTFLCLLLVLYGMFELLAPQIGETIESLISSLPAFFYRVREDIMVYLADHPDLMDWLNKYTDFNSMDWGALIQKAISMLTEGLGNIVDKAISTVVSLGTGIFNGVLSLVFALYCLARKEVLARQGRRLLYSVFPEKVCDETVRILRLTNTTFSRFISGQCLEAVILGVMFAIAMTIFDMPYTPLISVIIAITALVPIVGAFAGCILGAFFIMVVNPIQAFWFVIMFLVLQQIEGNLIYPKVVGTSIGLPGMWVLVALFVGSELMGVPGMLIMIPLASVLYALAREFTQKRLAARGIPAEKLQDQPLDVSSRFTAKSEKKKPRNFFAVFKRKKKE